MIGKRHAQVAPRTLLNERSFSIRPLHQFANLFSRLTCSHTTRQPPSPHTTTAMPPIPNTFNQLQPNYSNTCACHSRRLASTTNRRKRTNNATWPYVVQRPVSSPKHPHSLGTINIRNKRMCTINGRANTETHGTPNHQSLPKYFIFVREDIERAWQCDDCFRFPSLCAHAKSFCGRLLSESLCLTSGGRHSNESTYIHKNIPNLTN